MSQSQLMTNKNKEFSVTMEVSTENDIDVDIKDRTKAIDTSEKVKETTFLTSTPKRKIQSCEKCLDTESQKVGILGSRIPDIIWEKSRHFWLRPEI